MSEHKESKEAALRVAAIRELLAEAHRQGLSGREARRWAERKMRSRTVRT